MTRSTLLLAGLGALGAGLALGILAGSGNPRTAEDPSHEPAASLSSEHSSGSTRSAAAASGDSPEAEAGSLPANASVAETLARLRAETDPNRRRRLRDELCASLDAAGVQALLAALDQKFVQPFDREMEEALMGRWAELDPHAAAEYAAQPKMAGRLLYTVMSTWATSDLAAAKEWALSRQDRESRRAGLSAIITVLGETDPQSALAFLGELPATEDKSIYIYGLFQNYAEKNPARAAELALQITPSALRQTALMQVASAWGQKEPGKALAWLLGIPSANDNGTWQNDSVTTRLLKNWLGTDPKAAVAFVGAQPPGATRSGLVAALGESWGATDPAAAAGWLATLPKSEESYQAFSKLIDSWSETDVAAAGNFLLSRPADRTRDWLLGRLGSDWVEQDPAAALAWATQQSAPEVERLVAAQALGAMAAKDLANADQYLAQLKTPEARNQAVTEVSNKLTMRDPEAAAKWTLQMATADNVGHAIEYPVRRWTQQDPDAVSGWLNDQPAGPQKDAAMDSFANTLSSRDVASAAAWANTITDETLRTKRLTQIVSTWAGQNSAAAQAWVEGQGFAAPQQAALLKTLARASQK